jgi:ABC-2 type transport system permease protein
MRREGSAFTGVNAVFMKEYADHLSSARMRVLEWLVVLTGLGAVALTIRDYKGAVEADRFLFLRLFSYASETIPISFLWLISFLVPLVAIGLGFDSVNSEFNRRTMSRILSQPIYRDALLLGKFLAGLATLATGLAALWLIVIGAGLLTMGVPPSGEEVARSVAFLVATIAYAGVWLAVAILFSVIFRSTATSALCALGLWLFLTIIWPMMLVGVVVQLFVPPDPIAVQLGAPSPAQLEWSLGLARLSPYTLFTEASTAILQPSTFSLGVVFLGQLQGMLRGTALPLGQSLLIAWPQLTALIGAVIVVFTMTYVTFQRQEVRA